MIDILHFLFWLKIIVSICCFQTLFFFLKILIIYLFSFLILVHERLWLIKKLIFINILIHKNYSLLSAWYLTLSSIFWLKHWSWRDFQIKWLNNEFFIHLRHFNIIILGGRVIGKAHRCVPKFIINLKRRSLVIKTYLAVSCGIILVQVIVKCRDLGFWILIARNIKIIL